MKIREAKELPEGTPVLVTGGRYAGMKGTLVMVRQYEGLIRAQVSFPWQPSMGQPRIDRAVWLRPSEIDAVSAFSKFSPEWVGFNDPQRARRVLEMTALFDAMDPEGARRVEGLLKDDGEHGWFAYCLHAMARKE